MRTNGSRSVRHGESAIAAMTMACSKVCFAGQSCHRKLRRRLRGVFVCEKLSSYEIMVQPQDGTGR